MYLPTETYQLIVGLPAYLYAHQQVKAGDVVRECQIHTWVKPKHPGPPSSFTWPVVDIHSCPY